MQMESAVKTGLLLLASATLAAWRPAATYSGGWSPSVEHGAYIYAGRCDSIGVRVLFDIGDLEPERRPRGGAESRLEGSGPVYEEDEDITATIQELLASPHAVVVRERDDRSSPVIACGEIAGQVSGDTLSVTLRPVGGSSVAGVAIFGPNRDRDDHEPTEVLVQVRHRTQGGAGS
jgi:hypothetical protein